MKNLFLISILILLFHQVSGQIWDSDATSLLPDIKAINVVIINQNGDRTGVNPESVAFFANWDSYVDIRTSTFQYQTKLFMEDNPGTPYFTVNFKYDQANSNTHQQVLKYSPDEGDTIYTLSSAFDVVAANDDDDQIFYLADATVETTATTAAPTTQAPTTAAPTTQPPCENGQYRDQSDTCQDCPAGYRGTNQQGDQSTACTTCQDGEYSNAGATECSTCGIGEFSNAGATECSTCPAGTQGSGTSGNQATACTTCQNGYTSVEGGQCEPCDNGEYSNAGDPSCSPCPAGKRGTNQQGNEDSACTPCENGEFSNAGDSVCSQCPAGKQGSGVSGDQNTACEQCSANMYSTESMNSCENCPAGTQGTDDRKSCECCPVDKTSNEGENCQLCTGQNAVSLFGECLEPDSDSKEDKEAFVKEILNKSKTGDTTNNHDFCKKTEGRGKRKRQRDLMKSIKQILRQLRDEGVKTKVKKGEILMTDKVINKMGKKSDIEVIYAVEKDDTASCDDKDVNLYDQPDTYDVSTEGDSPLLICANDEPIMKMKVTTEATETEGGVYSVSCYEDNGWNSYDSYNEGDTINCLGTIFYANSAAGLTCNVNQPTPTNGGIGNCNMTTLGEGQECEITCEDDTYRAVNGKCKQVGNTVEYVLGYCEARALGTDCNATWVFDQNRCDALLATYNDKKCCGDNDECQGLQKEFQCRQCCDQPPVVLNYQLESVQSVEACRGETVIVNFLSRLNIQEMLGVACDSGDIGEPIVGFHNELEQRTFIALGAESGSSRYFRSTEGCSADGGKFILTCNVN